MVPGVLRANAGAMTTTPIPPAPPEGPEPGTTRTDDGPRVTRDEVRDLTRLRRTVGSERTIAGVAGGLGRHLDIDPVILRVAFVVLAFFGGAGILLYGACWLLVPDDSSTKAPLGMDDRSRGIGLVIAGGVAVLAMLGTSLGDGFVPLPLVVVAAVALIVVMQVGRKRGGVGAQAPVGPTPPWTPAPTGRPPAPVRTDPRKRGPVLFWFTLALSALGIGVLGLLDLAGARVPDPAYPGLVVGVVGAMLVLGAFWGRAGGLVLVGLIASVGLVGSIAAQEIDGADIRRVPVTAAAVEPSYDFSTGGLVLDLREVQDPAALAGRTITLSGEVGQISVLLPEGLDVTASAAVDGPGHVRVLGNERGGIDTSLRYRDPLTGAPALTIDARLQVGSIDIQTYDRTN